MQAFLSAFGQLRVQQVDGIDHLRQREDLLRTEDVSLISHIHGRERRLQRNVMRVELQAALKYGRKERTNPGRDGSPRWRYTHNGVVYITDESSRHEITCWRIDGADQGVAPAAVELGGCGSHAILIVDNSGSMRKNDVPGYESRAHAVYDCLARDFADAQVRTGASKDVVVTMILMSDDATVVLDKHPLDQSLVTSLQNLSKTYPRSHGNYLPALDLSLKIMEADAKNRGNLLLLFLSDGAPSDHSHEICQHGIKVWEIDHRTQPLMRHSSKFEAWGCRKEIQAKMQLACRERIKTFGDVFGRDKVVVCTVGFGPPSEDFKVLQEMAEVLPRGTFQKLGLNANGLRTAFSSLSSSMTELRTEGGSSMLTRRDKFVDKNQLPVEGEQILGVDWWMYANDHFLGKYKYDPAAKEMAMVVLDVDATGLAFIGTPFAEGAERFVYRCTEISIPKDKEMSWWKHPVTSGQFELMEAKRCGLRLVAKEAKAEENLGRNFHLQFARVQSDAAALAELFNRRVQGPREWEVSFLPVLVYCVFDDSYAGNHAWVLVEPELDGKFTKWNNNAGAVMRGGKIVGKNPSSSPQALGGVRGVIYEDDEDDSEDEDGFEGFFGGAAIEVDEVPQAFSHFTFEASQGKQLVCDIQGTWNCDDGYMLTDPVIHYVSSRNPSRKHKNGATDKGREGVKKFFNTHQCGPLCRRLGLTRPALQG